MVQFGDTFEENINESKKRAALENVLSLTLLQWSAAGTQCLLNFILESSHVRKRSLRTNARNRIIPGRGLI